MKRAITEGKPLFAVLMLQSAPNSDTIALHPSVHPLIEEFQDVFPQDLPAGLPPKRGIEHQIDLLPGAPLPNKPTYICNPTETNGLQRQVQELIDKGYVRENTSTCSVRAFLVPKKDGTWRICIDSRAINNITIKQVSYSLT